MANKYDAVIIGAGIGGLVCGCYLAKAGVKVLIIEKHSQAGGCCASFRRRGFVFDAGVHYIGSIKGILGKIIDEIDIEKINNSKEIELLYKVFMPDFVIRIYSKLNLTTEEFTNIFPAEKIKIQSFFDFISQKNFLSIYTRVKKSTFEDILNDFFVDSRLKATLNILLANIGVSAHEAPAITAIVLLREYIFSKVVYPRGGMQSFSDAILKKFLDYGGDIILDKGVKQILVKNSTVKSVILDSEEEILANNVVSNMDAVTTFKKLLDVNSRERQIVNSLICSPSAFLLYLGINRESTEFLADAGTIVKCYSYNLIKQFMVTKKDLINGRFPFFVISSPSWHDSSLAPKNKGSLSLFTLVPYYNQIFWRNNGSRLSRVLIGLAENVIGNFHKNIEITEIATPYTFQRYTSNKEGAIYGWKANMRQANSTLLPTHTSIKGLFCAGHWVTGRMVQSGVPGVALSGRKAAELVLKQQGITWRYRPIFL